MSAPPIPCRRFPEIDDPFWDYGPGAFVWRETEYKGQGTFRALWILLPAWPSSPRDRPGVLHCLFPGGHGPANWAEPGPVNGWDGDEDRPTLTPSILTTAGDGWHGYLTRGELLTV